MRVRIPSVHDVSAGRRGSPSRAGPVDTHRTRSLGKGPRAARPSAGEGDEQALRGPYLIRSPADGGNPRPRGVVRLNSSPSQGEDRGFESRRGYYAPVRPCEKGAPARQADSPGLISPVRVEGGVAPLWSSGVGSTPPCGGGAGSRPASSRRRTAFPAPPGRGRTALGTAIGRPPLRSPGPEHPLTGRQARNPRPSGGAPAPARHGPGTGAMRVSSRAAPRSGSSGAGSSSRSPLTRRPAVPRGDGPARGAIARPRPAGTGHVSRAAPHTAHGLAPRPGRLRPGQDMRPARSEDRAPTRFPPRRAHALTLAVQVTGICPAVPGRPYHGAAG